MNVASIIPLATEKELEEHYIRQFGKDCSELIGKKEKLEKYLPNSGISLEIPDVTSIRVRYRQKVEEIKERFNLHTIPLTTKSLEDAFEQAIMHNPPFNEKGCGFQDAVIFLSVVDHLKQAENKSGAFVSKDGIFAEGEKALQSLAASEGIRITLFKTLDDLYAELEREVQLIIREQVHKDVDKKIEEWKQDQQVASESLTNHLTQIKDFIADNLEISRSIFALGRILEVRGITRAEIKNVSTPLPEHLGDPDVPVRSNGDEVLISFDVEVGIEVLLDTSTFRAFRQGMSDAVAKVKVNESTQQVTMDETVETEIHEHTLTEVVEIEAIATYVDGHYENLRFQSLKRKWA